LLNDQRQLLHAYLKREQIQQFIEIYRNVEEIGQPGLWLLTATGKALKVEYG
jgi:hypothetical protein